MHKKITHSKQLVIMTQKTTLLSFKKTKWDGVFIMID
jgi:hypothetical protein